MVGEIAIKHLTSVYKGCEVHVHLPIQQTGTQVCLAGKKARAKNS